MTNLIYRCLDCGHEEQTELQAPAEWLWAQRGAPRRLCPACGCASYPVAWHWYALGKIADDPRMDVTEIAHHQWSGCPNSLVCQQAGHYAGDCERGAVMPKCFAAIHQEIRALARQFERLERSERDRQV